MKRSISLVVSSLLVLLSFAFSAPIFADEDAYNDAITNFKKANES